MALSLRAIKKTKSSKKHRALLEDIKENCPQLKNINLSDIKGHRYQDLVINQYSRTSVHARIHGTTKLETL
jgi:hypothetical protein